MSLYIDVSDVSDAEFEINSTQISRQSHSNVMDIDYNTDLENNQENLPTVLVSMESSSVVNFYNCYTTVEDNPDFYRAYPLSKHFYPLSSGMFPSFDFPVNKFYNNYIVKVISLLGHFAIHSDLLRAYNPVLGDTDDYSHEMGIFYTMMDCRTWQSTDDIAINEHVCMVIIQPDGSDFGNVRDSDASIGSLVNLLNQPSFANPIQGLDYAVFHKKYCLVYRLDSRLNRVPTTRQFFSFMMWMRFVLDHFEKAYFMYINTLHRLRKWKRLRLFMSTKTIPIILLANKSAIQFWQFVINNLQNKPSSEIQYLLDNYWSTFEDLNTVCSASLKMEAAQFDINLSYVYRQPQFEELYVPVSERFVVPDTIKHAGWWSRSSIRSCGIKWDNNFLYEQCENPNTIWNNVCRQEATSFVPKKKTQCTERTQRTTKNTTKLRLF